MSRTWHLVISLVLTGLIGYIAYRGVPDWGEAWKVMLHGRPLWIALGLVLVFLHMILRALRWGVLLSPVKSGVSGRNLFSFTLIKYVVNIIPPRVGELVASVALARKENISAASVFAASIFERILDTLTVIVFFGAYLVFWGDDYLPSSARGREILLAVRATSIYGFVALALGFLVLVLLLRSRKWHGWMPAAIRHWVVSFTEGFRALHSPGAAAKVVSYSVVIWLVIVALLWSFLRAYLDSFPMAGSLLILALTVAGVAIPTPGGVGGYQFFMSLALVHFFPRHLSEVDPRSQAAGISNGCYLLSVLPVLIVGLYFLNREGLTLGRISRMGRETQQTGA